MDTLNSKNSSKIHDMELIVNFQLEHNRHRVVLETAVPEAARVCKLRIPHGRAQPLRALHWYGLHCEGTDAEAQGKAAVSGD